MPRDAQVALLIVAVLGAALAVMLLRSRAGASHPRRAPMLVGATLFVGVVSYALFRVVTGCLRSHVDCVPDTMIPDSVTRVVWAGLRFIRRILRTL
jgi:hypothetical protein